MSPLWPRTIPVGVVACRLIVAACSSDSTCDSYPRPAALGAAPAGFGPRMSCVMGVEYEDHFYAAQASSEVPDLGEPLTGVVIPECNDTGGLQGPGTPVTAYAAGDYCTTDVIAAVLSKGDDPTLLVAMD